MKTYQLTVFLLVASSGCYNSAENTKNEADDTGLSTDDTATEPVLTSPDTDTGAAVDSEPEKDLRDTATAVDSETIASDTETEKPYGLDTATAEDSETTVFDSETDSQTSCNASSMWAVGDQLSEEVSQAVPCFAGAVEKTEDQLWFGYYTQIICMVHSSEALVLCNSSLEDPLIVQRLGQWTDEVLAIVNNSDVPCVEEIEKANISADTAARQGRDLCTALYNCSIFEFESITFDGSGEIIEIRDRDGTEDDDALVCVQEALDESSLSCLADMEICYSYVSFI